ncbi:CHAT domain-containing protein [Actinocorallia herbida]|uniref:CHAT domain-containing protein n=1 Tax=Actinocorallia herbida TaxID=58109 RepID=A0A3N1CXM8_9ACTN|nr:CHAT domain-containing protein [Actinocorallia herbida]ROO86034.1 CHAT domain-containing protein [Actinocorallia herbida]
MTVPGWAIPLIFGFLLAVFLAVHRPAGAPRAARVLLAGPSAVFLTGAVSCFGYLSDGWDDVGVTGAGTAAGVHLAVVVLVMVGAADVVARTPSGVPPPFLSDEERRLLSRRPRRWRRARLLAEASALLLIGVGMPAEARWSFLGGLAWVAGGALAVWIALSALAGLRLRRIAGAAAAAPAGSTAIAELMAEREAVEAAGLDDLAAVDRKIEVLRRLSAAAPGSLEVQVPVLYDLSTAVTVRYGFTGERTDLDEAIDLGRQALAICPAGHFNRYLRRSTLASNLAARAHLGPDDQDIEDAVRIAEESVAETEGGAPVAAGWASSDLSDVLLERYRLGRHRADLDSAVEVARAALRKHPPGPERRVTVQRSLFNCLRQRYADFGDPADLDYSAATVRASLDAATREGADPTDHLTSFALVLGEQAAARFDRAFADEAVDLLTRALNDAGESPANRALLLAALGGVRTSRFELFGDLSDLDRAIDHGREVRTLCAAASLPVETHNLATRLSTRYDVLLQIPDLAEAIELESGVIAGTPEGADPDASVLSSQGVNLRLRFELTGAASDIDAAVGFGQAAVAAAQPGDHGISLFLSVLGDSLIKRFEAAGDPADLDEAVRVCREATTTPRPSADDPTRARAFDHLATALQTRFDLHGRLADLRDSLVVQRRAVALSPEDSPAWGMHQFNLGLGLEREWKRTGDPATAREAVSAWRRAVAQEEGPAQARIRSAVAWARVSGRLADWAAATDAFEAAIDLLPLVGWRGLEAASAENALSHWRLLASHAASAAVQCGQPERAVALLERGRGVLWSQVLETRSELDGLRAVDPLLAEELSVARRALDRDPESPGGHDAARSVRRMAAARDWDRLVARVRRIPGFGAFPGPPAPPDLTGLADEGPIVFLNASPIRCDAIVLTTAGPRVVPLPSLSIETLVERANEYVAALFAFETGNRGLADVVRVERTIARTLAWLWDDVAQPVLTALDWPEPSAAETPPRLWWCPTGFFTLLPVHAAGHHRTAGRSVLDRAVSSSISTLRTLADARAAAPPAGRPAPRVLLVALPQTPGRPALPGVHAERATLTGLVPPDALTVLEGPAATLAATTARIPEHTWLHFSCHGAFDLASPSRSGLVLHDGTLTTGALGATSATPGEFVFLSACRTATASSAVPDEAIHLTAALQHAGFRHVVGTLWSVYDGVGSGITEDVYARLRNTSGLAAERAAYALHEAVRRARDQDPLRPGRWAPFIHVGP